jgi:hypothetical protein
MFLIFLPKDSSRKKYNDGCFHVEKKKFKASRNLTTIILQALHGTNSPNRLPCREREKNFRGEICALCKYLVQLKQCMRYFQYRYDIFLSKPKLPGTLQFQLGIYRYCFRRIFGRPDIRLIQKPDTGYPVKARYRISGRILDFTTIYLVKYQLNFIKTASTILDFCKH